MQASDSDARQTLQTECPKRLSDCLRQNLGARQGELDKETNRKPPGRLLTQSRGDNKKIFTKTRGDFNGDKIIGRDPHVSPLDFLRMTILKIGRSLDDCLRNRGMMVNNKCCNLGMALFGVIFSIFLLFSNPSYSAICFLPDCHLDEEPKNVGIDAEYCEAAGYTYSASGACPANQAQDTCIFNPNYIKCDGTEWCYDNGYVKTSCTSPKVLDTPCPSNSLLYKYCVCPSEYKYGCTGTGYSSGNGSACDGKYTACTCATNYTWSGSACVCDSAFKYACTGTGYSSGSGASCGGKYKSCSCSTYYSWNGSACAHTHSYVCPSGYKESNSGMTNPTVTAKVCALSGCSSTSGECYKEGHSHSYSCPSGYESSCTNGYSGTASKTCSCGATSGTCYKCCADTYKYSCSGVGEVGSGTSCGGKYTACVCTSNYVSFCDVTFCS